MAVITASNLRLSYGARVVLDGADFVIEDGEHVGLVGRNGGGKTSLARILAAEETPDAGTVAVQGGARVAFLPQQPRFDDAMTAREIVSSGLVEWSRAMAEYHEVSEEIATGGGSHSLLARQAELAEQVDRLGGWDQAHRVERICQHLGLADLDRSVAGMSGGERRRVDLARVLVAQPSLAILDEPTNHLDVDTIEWLEEFLANEYRGALLLITHDRYVLDRVATRTLELERGTLTSYPGGWEAYLDGKAEREALEARTEANRQNLLRRELDWLRRSPKARTTKSKSRIQRAEALVAAGPPPRERELSALAAQRADGGKIAFELSALKVMVNGRPVIDGLDLVVRRGDRVGIVGVNGIGKTTLLKVLIGELQPTSGVVRVAPTTKFAYFDQERTRLDDDATVLANVCANRDVVDIGGRSMSVHAYLSRFSFDGSQQRQRVGTLSGGERARVQLAKFLLQPANVLLLDEPTNDLDVATLAVLEDFLVDAGMTALLVTHDRYFLDRVAESVLAFEGDGRVVRYEGSYQAFRAERDSRRAAAEVITRPAPPRPSPSPPARTTGKGLTFTERHELERIMPLIEEAEAEVEALNRELADPELYLRRGDEARALQDRLAAAQAVLDARIARWEQLESKRESGE